VPELLGVSIASTAEGLTFTFVASSDVVATLDALQYLDGGPCLEAVRGARVVDVPDADALDEQQWQLFAQGESAAGVRSTLSLPVVTENRVTGGVNLHASRAGAFHGRHHQLADVFVAWAAGAVTNADLSFRSRLEAAKAPAQLDALDDIAKAVGVVAARQGSARAEPRRGWNAPAPWPGSPPSSWPRPALATSSSKRPHRPWSPQPARG
jgi:GAF domain-containing protein